MSEPMPSRPVVLIVEDEPLQRMMMVDMVEEAGFETAEAWSADEAVRILEGRPDIRIVFTDLDMRGSTAGLKLALMIRDRWPPIELLMISSQTHRPESLPHRGVLLGKPFDQHRIVAALHGLTA